MYKRIIVVVSSVLFSLLALLAFIITDLYDRDFPQAIGVKNRITLDFSESNLSITESLATLQKLDARWDMGLVKIAPDLTSDGDGQIFAALNDGGLSDQFTWFGSDDVGKIVGKERLETSYPDGFYLVTGDNTHLDDFKKALTSKGVKVGLEDASIFESLKFVVWERGFAAAVLSAFTLIITLALFWLSLKARDRALRVLGGVPTIRIQLQDFSGFLGLLFISAGIITFIATGYVIVFHGSVYVGPYLKALITLQLFVIAVSIMTVLIMSAFSWPSATMLATRQPAVKSLCSLSSVIQALTFLLVISAAGPAWSQYKHSTAMADEMAQWKQLADQVTIEFATDIGDMDIMEPRIRELVKDAEARDAASLSYTYTPEMANFREYAFVSFVNERWLDLVTKNKNESVVRPISQKDLPDDMEKMIQEEIEILSRDGRSEDLLEQLQFLRPVEGFRIPIAQGGGGERLHFSDNVLLVVVPTIYETYNDSALTSMSSSKNIIFTGVSSTQKLLEEHQLDVHSLRKQGIQGELNIVYIAEEGIIQAQFASYIAWLQFLALIALIVAFTVSTAIRALITARLQAKRDFPLRLCGRSWIRIIQSRVAKEILIGAILMGVVLLLISDLNIGVSVVIIYGLLAVPVSHLFAVRWCFDGVSRRRI